MPRPAAGFLALRNKAALQRIPLHSSIELTLRCNQRCGFCYLGPHLGQEERELSRAEYEDAFEQMAALQTLFVSFTGGEILVRADALDIIEAACARAFACTVYTNGQLVDRACARRLQAAGVYQVHVSLLGPEEIHDRIAGAPDAFKRAIRAMDLLREAGLHVVAKLVLSRPAVAHVRAMRELAEQHADSFVQSGDILPAVAGPPVADELVLRAEDYRHFPPPTEDDHAHYASPPLTRGPICSAGRSLFALSPSGEVFPCVIFRKPVGSLREKPLAEIWNGPAMLEVSRLQRQDLAGCEGCRERAFCNFCMGQSYNATGRIDQPAPTLCSRARRLRDALRRAPCGFDPP